MAISRLIRKLRSLWQFVTNTAKGIHTAKVRHQTSLMSRLFGWEDIYDAPAEYHDEESTRKRMT